MKRILFLLISGILCLSNVGMAQDLGLSIGIKGGVQMSNLYVDDVDDENAKIGFLGGLYFKNQITESFALQPELYYTLKGSEIAYSDTYLGGIFGTNGSYRYNLGYVELPVLAVISLGAFNIHAGPYVALLTNANIKRVNDGDIDEIADLDRDDFNTLDYGIAGGVGFDFLAGTIGLRYTYGLNEIANKPNAVTATGDAKNSVLSLYAGFHF